MLPGGAVTVAVRVEFLDGNRGMARDGAFGGFGGEVFSQLLVAEVGGVLVGDLTIGESLVGNREGKLTGFDLGPYDTVIVVRREVSVEIPDIGSS